MAGINDAAIGKLNSQNKFNGGAELEEDYGVNLYATFYRRYDPQIGRFSGVDCQSEASAGMSVYQFKGNNPVSMNDPLGDKQVNGLRGGSNGYYYGTQHSYVDDNGNYWHHEDGLVGASSWMDGGPFDGGGGSGVGDGGSGSSGTYLGYWNNLFNNSPNGATTYTNDPALLSLSDDPKHPYGYTSENNLGAFNTNVSHGDAFYDQEMDERFFLTSFKGLDLVIHWYNWDGPIMRTLVPDFVSVGVGFNGIVGIGGGSSVELQWVLHGQEASWKPAVTATQSIGAGYSVDATLNVGSARYSGKASDITRTMLATNSFGKGDFPTLWGNGGVAALGKIGFTGTFTYTGSGNFIYGGQINIGGGLPAGLVPVNGATGISNTWVLYDFWKK